MDELYKFVCGGSMRIVQMEQPLSNSSRSKKDSRPIRFATRCRWDTQCAPFFFFSESFVLAACFA